jgi:hypothetical protein
MDAVRRWALSPIVGEDYVRDVPVAPEAIAARLRAAINVRPKRALGVIKISPEWKGAVTGNEFAIWEKQRRATRMVGRIKARRGGSRVEARLEVQRRTWVLMAVLFALFAVTSIGLLQRETGMGLGASGLAVAVLGALVLLVAFWSAQMRQRAMLKALLNEVLRSAERG